MLLKKLSLYNFRPFKGNHEIVFSTDKEKNVTLVMAGNGAGKTTLAQAFQWVLYGRTDGFKNKSVLNSIVENELNEESSVEVKVSLELEHNDVEYVIVRKQNYRKDINGIVKQDASVLEIINKEDDGQTSFPSSARNLSIVSSILPETLSKYFFFDGERIEKMAGEVNEGKSSEFKEAVQNILGLTALNKAIEHLNPNASTSVIGRYNAKIDQQGNDEIRFQREIIYNATDEIEKNEERIEKLAEEMQYYDKEINHIKSELLSYADAEKAQKQLNELNRNLDQEKIYKNSQIKSLVAHFSSKTNLFMSKKLINDALEELIDTDSIDKGIPDITRDTINYLLERKKCICGNDLCDKTSIQVRNLYDLIQYVKPECIGTSISKFKSLSENHLKVSEGYYQMLKNIMSSYRRSMNKIEEYEHDIGDIDKKILNSQNNKIADLKARQQDFERTMKSHNDELSKLHISNGILKEKKSNAEAEIARLQLKIDNNDAVQEQLNYALKAFEIIKATYDKEEKSVRDLLEEEINELFKQIYAGGMTISINEKYKISSFVTDLDENLTSNLDANTARSYSIIFAFIVSVINIAKKKMNKEEDKIITDEYPLVMDAPLSSFDQRRIKNICQVIPSIARQVIIFIKDTDGKIARDEMDDRIGIEYEVYLKDKDYPVDSVIKKVGE